MPEPHLRAGDADREAVAASLGTHMAAGRLTLAEYDERVARAYAAQTFGELAELTADLPGSTPATPATPRTVVPSPGLPRPTPPVPDPPKVPTAPVAWHGHPEHSWRAWLTTSVTVVAIYLVISLASWEFSYFWPIWVIGPWGAVLLAQSLGSRGPSSREKRPQVDR